MVFQCKNAIYSLFFAAHNTLMFYNSFAVVGFVRFVYNFHLEIWSKVL